MDNTAKILSEVAAASDVSLSDAMVAEIIEREKYIEQRPNEWISAEESIARLRKRATIV